MSLFSSPFFSNKMPSVFVALFLVISTFSADEGLLVVSLTSFGDGITLMFFFLTTEDAANADRGSIASSSDE